LKLQFQAFLFALRESDRLFGLFKQPKAEVSITAIYRGLELPRFQAVYFNRGLRLFKKKRNKRSDFRGAKIRLKPWFLITAV
jgi:hypothetical protein